MPSFLLPPTDEMIFMLDPHETACAHLQRKKYYGAADIAKILGVITLINAIACATMLLSKEYIAAKDGVQRFKYSNPPKGANPTKGVFLYERFES